MWLAIVRMLAMFVFRKPVNDKGEEYTPVVEWETAITRYVPVNLVGVAVVNVRQTVFPSRSHAGLNHDLYGATS